MATSVQTYPLQQLALHEGLHHVVRGGEVPGLVGDVDRLEPGGERVLQEKQKDIKELPALWCKISP